MAAESYDARRFPVALAINMPRAEHTAEMMCRDLAAAEISHADEASRYADFHALRRTFVTNLARSGVHPQIAQELSRHSTTTLTMDRHTHSLIEAEAAAPAALPALPDPGEKVQEAARATATGGRSVDSVLPENLPGRSDPGEISVDPEGPAHHPSEGPGSVIFDGPLRLRMKDGYSALQALAK